MKLIALFTVTFVAFAGCSGLSESLGDAVAERATEALLEEVEASISVKDAFADGLKHVFVSFGQVALHKTSGEWIRASNEVGEIDLLALQAADAKAEIAKFTVPGGSYDTISLKILTLRVENADGPVAITLNSPYLVVPIEALIANQFAALLDFDLATSFDDMGNFVPAIKNVQLSTIDSDNDGQSDFDDTDDDNDGLTDDKDSDVNGDGKEDAPPVKRDETPSKANRIVGPSGFTWTGSKVENVAGEFARTGGKGIISFNTGHGMDVQSVYVYHNCEGRVDVGLTLDQMNDKDAVPVIEISRSIPCGWYRVVLGDNELWPQATAVLEITSKQGLGAIASLAGTATLATPAPSTSSSSTMSSSSTSSSTTSSSSSASSSTTSSSSTSTSTSNPNLFRIEGEDTFGVSRSNESNETASKGWVKRDVEPPNYSNWDFNPWNFTIVSNSVWKSVDVQVDCEPEVTGLIIEFSDVFRRWHSEENWLSFYYDCGSGIVQYDLSSFGALGEGIHELFMAYEFSEGAAAIDYIGFEYASNGG